MWHITNIEAKNFISFKSLDLDIPQDGCSLIYGLNEDNAQQKNNGTGKSSVIEAICFALTGESLRGVKDGELINDNADKAFISMTLENDYDQTLFTIERIIDRKNPQHIEVHKYDASDKEIDQHKTVQATVLDYNRYILDEIGLSKDDLFSNFILSNSRYESFFNASDKAKKAMINRFSGADAVDKSIEALKVDAIPAEEALAAVREKKVAIDAKIEAVDSQIADSEAKKEEFAANKAKRIEEISNRIAEKREELRGTKETIEKAKARMKELNELLISLQDIEENSNGLESDYADIQACFEKAKIEPLKNYVEESRDTKTAITELEKKKESLENEQEDYERALRNLKKLYDTAKKASDSLTADNEKADKEDQLDLDDIAKDIEDIQKAIDSYEEKRKNGTEGCDKLDRQIRELKNMLHGAITCPKCSHTFFLSEDRSVKDVEKELKDTEDKYQELTVALEGIEKGLKKCNDQKYGFLKECEDIKADMEKRKNDLQVALKNTRSTLHDVEESEASIESIMNRIKRTEDKILTEKAKLETISKLMFDSAVDSVESSIEKGKNYMSTLNDKVVAIESAISTYEASRKEAEKGSADDLIASLIESKKTYEAQQKDVLEELVKAQDTFDKFVMQEAHFVQFKSHLANKKVEAISAVTNSFLEKIGSDLRVELLGFKVLKTGKLRDKISVNLIRNGVPCGSYAKFSGGERARVNLASILALQKLTNNSCEKGKGLDITILDEVLEASDSTGIESCCLALNKLGVTSMIITQNPIVDHDGKVILVVKENGYSHIKE